MTSTGSHPWHDIPVGKKAPDVVLDPEDGHLKVVKCRYEIDKETGLLFVDRDILVLMQSPVPPLSFLRARPIGAMRMIDCGEQDDKIIAVCADDPAYKHYTDVSQLPPHRWKEIRSFFTTYKRGQLEEKFGLKVKVNTEEIVSDNSRKLGRTVSRVTDPFKHEPLSPSKGVTVSEEQIDAEEAKLIIIESQKMYKDHYLKKKDTIAEEE